MLRIHIEERCSVVTIRLEGRLSGAWVAVLDRCWQSTLASSTKKPLIIELEAVAYVDGPGEWLLQEMHKSGANLVGRGTWSRYLVEQIQQLRTS
jgi:anti-anti-sigma regulatory factor